MRKNTNVIKLSENQLYNVITEILTQVLQEGYVGSLRKKIYGQDPNEKSTLDIYSDEDNKNRTYYNHSLSESAGVNIPKEYIIDEETAQKFGFRKSSNNPFNGSIYEMWVNPQVTLKNIRALQCKPYRQQQNADGTFKVAIIVLPEKQNMMAHPYGYFDKMRKIK